MAENLLLAFIERYSIIGSVFSVNLKNWLRLSSLYQHVTVK